MMKFSLIGLCILYVNFLVRKIYDRWVLIICRFVVGCGYDVVLSICVINVFGGCEYGMVVVCLVICGFCFWIEKFNIVWWLLCVLM